jgi:hypothetical protein
VVVAVVEVVKVVVAAAVTVNVGGGKCMGRNIW